MAGLRAALERLQVRHDGTVRELRERCGRNEREHRQEHDRLQRLIDELQRQMKQSSVGRDDDDTVQRREKAALHGRLDRLMAEQSLLWDLVGRITMTTTTTGTDDDPSAAIDTAVHQKSQQRKKVVGQEPLPNKLPSPPQQQNPPPTAAESSCYVNKKQLNYELERLMQIWKAQMGDLASFFHTSLDEAKLSIDRARAETRFLVDAALQRNHQQSQRQYETLSAQMAHHTKSIAEVREDQEVSNMALIDTMSCMKTKFDAVLEELHLYGTLPQNSLITNTAEGETSSSGNNSGHSGIGRNVAAGSFFQQQQQQQQQYNHKNDDKNDDKNNDHHKNLTAPQIFERKTGQWHAQFKSLRAELRAIRRENADQRQDVDEVKLLLETSVNVLCQQAETTATLCEKQLRRLHDHVRRDCVTMIQLRDTVRTEAQETDRPWQDRFRELLHALENHHEQHQTHHRESGATLRVDSVIVASPPGGRGGGGAEAAASSDSQQQHQSPSSPRRDPASRTHEPTRLLLPPSATTSTSGGVFTITSFRCKTDATLDFASPSHEYVDKATVTQTKKEKKMQKQEKEKDRRRGDATASSSDAGNDEAGEDDTCEVMATASIKKTVEAHQKDGIIDLTGILEERDDVESEANMLPPQQ
jgi:hypothetical protein